MKLLTIPNSIEEIEKTKQFIDGIIVGIENFSVNTNLNISIDELKSLIDKFSDLEIFVSLNKNIRESEIDTIVNIMKSLDDIKIAGLLYADIGILNIYNQNNFKYDLIYAQEHFTTNCETINFWTKYGIKGVYISNDITKEEAEHIIDKVSVKTMMILFGYLPMYVSFRRAVKNYQNYFNLEEFGHFIYKEGKTYPIVDKKTGTEVYSDTLLNGLQEYNKLNLDYGIINSLLLDSEQVIDVVTAFKENDSDKLDDMFKNLSRGFMDTKTIYRVKKNDK